MRRAVIETLIQVAEADDRVVLLTGDLGFTVVEAFAERFPDRFYNVGVAEQNMVGMAAGLAEAGFFPYVYSIATFAAIRPYEFIRNNAAQQHLPVRVLGIGGGFEYEHAGPSHFALEDVALMRVQPGMTTIVPADHRQAAAALRATWDLPRPLYMRVGKDESYEIEGLNGRFELGALASLGDGGDVVFVCMGSLTRTAAEAMKVLSRSGVQAELAIVSSFNPDPTEDLARVVERNRCVVSVESHYANGGVGSFVAEVIAESGLARKLVRCAVHDQPDAVMGSEAYLLERHGLSEDALVKTALELLG